MRKKNEFIKLRGKQKPAKHGNFIFSCFLKLNYTQNILRIITHDQLLLLFELSVWI